MKRNRQFGLLGLALAVSLVTVAALAQTQKPAITPQKEVKADASQPHLPSNEEMFAMVDSVGQLGDKLKQVIAPKEKEWKLTQHEAIDIMFEQTWIRKEQKVKVRIEESLSLEESAKHFKYWIMGSSISLGERFEGLGDEAAKLCYTAPLNKECAIHVRKGKVRFTFLALAPNSPDVDLEQLLETAKRFAGHALTIDDAAMKAEN